MEITFREIREFGESLIILDQHPSQISLPALGNTYCTITMNLKHSKDVNTMSQCMLLSESKDKEILGSLDVGYAMVKLQGRYPKPFLIRIPEFEVKKGIISDEYIRKKMVGVCYKETSNTFHSENPQNNYQEDLSEQNLSELELQFLMDVFKYPDHATLQGIVGIIRHRRIFPLVSNREIITDIYQCSISTVRMGRGRSHYSDIIERVVVNRINS